MLEADQLHSSAECALKRIILVQANFKFDCDISRVLHQTPPARELSLVNAPSDLCENTLAPLLQKAIEVVLEKIVQGLGGDQVRF